MKLITDNAALAKAIKSIAVRGQKLDHDIHVAGTSCLQHIANHSDTTLLNDLVNALPKGARKHAFVEWALAYGNVSLLDKSLKLYHALATAPSKSKDLVRSSLNTCPFASLS